MFDALQTSKVPLQSYNKIAILDSNSKKKVFEDSYLLQIDQTVTSTEKQHTLLLNMDMMM